MTRALLLALLTTSLAGCVVVDGGMGGGFPTGIIPGNAGMGGGIAGPMITAPSTAPVATTASAAPGAPAASTSPPLPGLPLPGLPAVEVPLAAGVALFTPTWTAKRYPGNPKAEALIVKYTNEARAKEGKPPLRGHLALHVGARQHSDEMADEDYFEHASPHAAWASPSDRVRLAGYRDGASENIWTAWGIGTDPETIAREALDGWINSKGHYENIMGATAEIGVGVAIVGDKVYATQVFGDQPIDFTRVTLEDQGGQRLLRAEGTVGSSPYTAGTVTVDGEKVPGATLKLAPGQPFTLTARVPQGGNHTVGIDFEDPDGNDYFWPTELFWLDTDQAGAAAFLAGDYNPDD